MQTAHFNLLIKALAYGDTNPSNNPVRRFFDWATKVDDQSVSNPKSIPYVIPAGTSQAVFSGLRSTSIASNTSFTLTLSPLAANRYRFTNTAGTAPVFRTNRGLTPSGRTYTWALLANSTSSLTSSLTSDFASVVVGDILFVPGISTGDVATVFNSLNEGWWVVLANTGTVMQLARFTGETYSGAAEATVATSNTQIVAFSAAGVQIGDYVDVSAGFSTPVLSAYRVVAVTPSWFEVLATASLPSLEVAIPGVAGMIFYSAAKKFLLIEADQEVVVQANGETTLTQRVSPIVAGDSENVGFYVKWGTIWSLTVYNRSAVDANVLILTAE